MTPAELRDDIVRRTGLPKSVVAYVLDTQTIILSECILREEDCYIGDILKLSTSCRKFSTIDPKTNSRQVVERLSVSIKPRKPFRRRMNNGKIRRSDST
jgi:nucleoid DNA-binding protein